MRPLIVMHEGQPVYFSVCMFPTDELQVDKPAIINVHGNEITVYQADDKISDKGLRGMDRSAKASGFLGVVRVVAVSPTRIVFSKDKHDYMVFTMSGNSITGFDIIAKKKLILPKAGVRHV